MSALVAYLLSTLWGLALAPWLAVRLRTLVDRGWSLARLSGLLAGALLDRWVTSTGFLDASPRARSALLLVGLGAACWLSLPAGLRARRLHWLRRLLISRGPVVGSLEAFHLALFLGALWIFNTDPRLETTERPMDAALLVAEAQARQVPPVDPWLAGETLRYYSLGHRAAALLAAGFEDVPLAAYPSALALWFAGSAAGLGSLAASLAARSTRRSPRGHRRKTRLFLLATLGILAANPLACRAGLERLRDSEAQAAAQPWWWPASRGVQDRPTAADPGERISEFPLFTLRVGDLHAHFLALPLGLLAIAAAIETVRARSHRSHRTLWVVLVGSTALAHPWDLPRLLLLSGSAHLLPTPTRSEHFARRLADLLAIWVLGGLVALPGLDLYFEAPWRGLRLTEDPTSPAELAGVWGGLLPGCLLAVWLSTRATTRNRRALALLLGSGTLLALVPELFYLQDAHGSRFNTFFKMHASAWPLLLTAAVTAALVPTQGLLRRGCRWGAWAGLLSGAPYLAGLAADALRSPFPYPPRPIAATGSEAAEIHQALDWVRTVVPRGLPVLQTPGESYVAETVLVSVHTGRPHPLGWIGHQLQWRGSRALGLLKSRRTLAQRVFTTDDEAQLLASLEALGTRWIWVGPTERFRYPGLEERLAGSLTLRFRNRAVSIWELSP